jgi:hypothetical protein
MLLATRPYFKNKSIEVLEVLDDADAEERRVELRLGELDAAVVEAADLVSKCRQLTEACCGQRLSLCPRRKACRSAQYGRGGCLRMCQGSGGNVRSMSNR